MISIILVYDIFYTNYKAFKQNLNDNILGLGSKSNISSKKSAL